MLCLGVGLAAYLILGRSEEATLPPGVGPSEPLDSRADEAVDLLSDLTRAVKSGSPAELTSLAADSSAARELLVMRANVLRLGLTDLSLRYVDEQAGRAPGPRSWVADVAVTWRLRGYDRSPSEREVAITVQDSRDGARFVSAGQGADDAVPLWMLDRLRVGRGTQSLVMVAAQSVGDYEDMADQAVVDVRKVLPGWRGRLVVEVPSSERELDRVLGAKAGSYSAIAAVTTTVDGSLDDSAPVHVFVNPEVFERLGEQGAQIVMSHEAAHVATGAATADLPVWLLEGFADYVALAEVDLPVDITASQVLGQVRREGAPDRLPGPVEFDAANTALGASYESAWLACRLLAETYGEGRLLRFYERADQDSGTDAAFAGLLGTTERAFTADWRSYLTDLAG